MADNLRGCSPNHECDCAQKPQSDLSCKTYNYLVEGRKRGHSFRELIDACIGTAPDPRIYIVTGDLDGAHAYLFIQNRLDLINDNWDAEVDYV